ncbi:MAG: hypothetical protein ACTHOF_15040 [Flavisolibacter sp.]
MRRNSTSSIGAFHPVVFFTLVYGISLLLAIFVCRTVYYSINEQAVNTNSKAHTTVEASVGATALR